MNTAGLVKLIRDGLDAAAHTKVPVVVPGTPLSKLPCVVIAPSTNQLLNGNRTLSYGFDVVVIVPRYNQPDQYLLLESLEAVVLGSLIPSEVQIEGTTVFDATGGDDTGDPPALTRTIPVTFTSDVDLC